MIAVHVPRRCAVRSNCSWPGRRESRWFPIVDTQRLQVRNTKISSPFVLGTATVSVDRGHFVNPNLIALPCEISTHELIYNRILAIALARLETIFTINTMIADEVAVCRLARSDYLHHCFIVRTCSDYTTSSKKNDPLF